jgi:serine/threonine-protein kinase
VAANYLGAAYFLLGQFEKSAAAWEKASRGEPDAELYANLGSSYFFLGRFDEAVTFYRKALDLAPESFENWGNLADAYRYSPTQADLAPAAYERAIELAHRHIRINPSDAIAIAALGHYQACLGMREQSRKNVDLARQLAQKDMFVYYFAATALCALDEQDEALSAVHRALSLGYPVHMVEADAGLSSLKALPEYRAAFTESLSQETKFTEGEGEP